MLRMKYPSGDFEAEIHMEDTNKNIKHISISRHRTKI